jgi:hypothetical protein
LYPRWFANADWHVQSKRVEGWHNQQQQQWQQRPHQRQQQPHQRRWT